jgi:prophage regulatory protein
MSDTTKRPADSERLLRRRDVQARVGLGSSQIYALMKEGKFPKAVPLVGKTRAWVESEVNAWIAKRIQEGRQGGAQ